MDWLSLITAAILGIVVGSVCTALPYRRQNEAFHRRIRNLHLEAQHLERALKQAQDQANALQTTLRTAQAAKGALEVDLGQLTRERDLLMAALLERTAQLEQALAVCQAVPPSAGLADAQARPAAPDQANAA
jgi:septal ring factor EnvC (AmiA/AmiB activator)